MKTLALSFAILLLAGCSRSLDNGYVEVKADSTWSVRLPKRLKPSSELHPFAPIQYWNRTEAFFVVGLSESKDSMIQEEALYTLEDYTWFVQDQLCMKLDSCRPGNMDMDSCGIIPCMDAEWIAELADDGMEVYYRVRVCEGEDHFYQLICWTTPERGMKHQSALDTIMLSLREQPSAAPLLSLP